MLGEKGCVCGFVGVCMSENMRALLATHVVMWRPVCYSRGTLHKLYKSLET